MKMKLADIIFPAFLIALSVLGLSECGKFTESAALLPRICLWILIGLSAGIMLKALIRNEDKKIPFNWGRAGIIIGSLIAYVVLIPIAGYYAATVIFTFILMLVFGVKNKIGLIAVPLGFALFVFLVFGQLLSLTPPKPFFM